MTENPKPPNPRRAALFLGALGVVFGDIGTSPLYTLKAVLDPGPGGTVVSGGATGATSAILWALMLVVTLKYVALVLRADHRGEGGILTLTALARRGMMGSPRWHHVLLVIGVLGAALFYGDSVITPAISVLGAMEGLEVVSPGLKIWVVPLSIAVVALLFWIQRKGTGAVGRSFGPVMLVWFAALAVTGVAQIVKAPRILHALDPRAALHFLSGADGPILLLLGSVVLAVTGAEALYADMGHFGRIPIRRAWLGLVFPSLALNYLGQGALLLRVPAAVHNPFFNLFPDPLQIPAILLATAASVIASQAVISGAFSLTQQAIQLGLLPRLRIRHTSETASGQIFLPTVNVLLFVAVELAILGFERSSALAAAYGIAVTITMFTTTLLVVVVAKRLWRLSTALLLVLVVPFLLLDAVLVAACALKFMDGGWFPLAIGLVLFTVMTTWRTGRELLQSAGPRTPSIATEVPRLEADHALRRVPRTAVFPTADPSTVPRALLHNLTHNQVLHGRNILLGIRYEDVPRVAEEDRVTVKPISDSFWQVYASYGFMEHPNIPETLAVCRKNGLDLQMAEVSYFLSREIVVPSPGIGMALWREHLFAWLSRAAESNVAYFQLPDEQVIVLAARIPI